MDKIKLLHMMMRIRIVEEKIAERYSEEKMRCPVHLSIGQEAPAAATGMLLNTSDYAISTHRGHAHYLAKGGNLKSMIAEIYGKKTGCSKGRGGSMHLIDLSVNFQGTTAIVGNSIPIGVGLGLACKLDGGTNISCIFLGDGAIEEGAFYESINFCAVKKLPVLFVCENNLYSVYSPIKVRQPSGRKIHEMVSALGIDSSVVDGNDAIAAFQTIDAAIMSIRSGEGPHFVELLTYRWREHCGPNYDNDLPYRSEEEFLKWKERDPIILLLNKLLKEKILSQEKYDKMHLEIENKVNDAFNFAELSPFPNEEEAYIDEYYT